MPLMQKFYFSRTQRAAVFAMSEEEARLELATYHADSEDFILDDVRPCVEIAPGEWKVAGS